MNVKMLTYTALDSPIHRLAGSTKLLFFALWSVTAMITYDTRCLLFMFLFGVGAFAVSKIKFASYSFVLYLILFFFLLNHIAIFIFSPQEGVKIYGTSHELFHLIGRYTVTQEQLFYQFNIMLKYATVVPVALLFVLTTDPSEFAASLNKIGVHYKIGFAVSLAMRYIPDVQRDYQNISFSAQARGIDTSRKEKLLKRLKNVVSILLPLILASIERIETISAAMELRGFGRNKRRTWYNAKPFAARDYLTLAFIVILMTVVVLVTISNGSRFYNPFR
ncbi:energy-coupling factor transporter transmembrane component T family protein [Paenibacillus sp. NPDC058071]|uniref:energy-coupling factor transporter transmembrane component T family protein n=1 Tax=Paenibacillus sp. NPDC058071 TaxID=3346326 RepID=UPI0036D9920B